MKNRDYKIFEKSGIYHVYNRGVGKMNIFKDKQDFRVFLSRLRENIFPENKKGGSRHKNNKIYERKTLPNNSFHLICYCLMPNHFHFLIQQRGEIPVSKLISKVCTSYSMYFNKKYKRVGTIFQDTFKAVVIETNNQLLWVSCYIHENPRKAELVNNLENYKFSSYLEYSGIRDDLLCTKNIILEQFHSSKVYLQNFNDSTKSKIAKEKLIGIQDLLLDEEDL